MKRFVLGILFAATVATGLTLTPSGVGANEVSDFVHCLRNGGSVASCCPDPTFCG
jgi:hypothetical protein